MIKLKWLTTMSYHQLNKIFVISLLVFYMSPADANSLCETDQKVIFSCSMLNNKLLSLCITANENNSICYKYGTHNKIELIYPLKNINKNNLFTYNHYYRYQTDYIRVYFKNENYIYTIFYDYEADGIEREEAGILIKNALTQNEYKYKCKKIETNHLGKLTKILNCNKDGEFGCEEL